MAIYIGSSKRSIRVGNAFTSLLILIGIHLKSLDDLILKDSNGVYLTVKEEQ